MSYNGSGTFLINSAGQPVVANTVISATVFNALTSDLATGLSTAITKDGQTTITNNIPFGSNKITGLGSGTAAADAANLGQVQSTVAKLITVTGTDTITGSMSPQLTAYAAGQLFYFVANAANTGAVTLNIDSLGAKSITRDGSSALAAGDINSGEVVVVIYDGTRFQMINAANSFGNTTINGTLTVTGNAGFQANVSITSALSVGGVFAVTGAATFTANPTLSGGTANGVLYLNGSKVATSGSALTFDGTNLGIGTASTTPIIGTRTVQIQSSGGATCYVTTGTHNAYMSVDTAGSASFATSTGSTTLGLGVANGNAVLIDANRNVGIGTTSPAVPLDVVSNSNAIGIGIRGRSADDIGTLNFYTNAGVASSQLQNRSDELRMLASGARACTFYTNGSERARIDSSGNLGLGVTPSASTVPQFQSGSNIVLTSTNSSYLAANATFNSSWKYISSAYATQYQQTNGAHAWYTAPSGTAGNAITFTQAMTLDASGNLGVGVTSPTVRLDVAGSINTTSRARFEKTGTGKILQFGADRDTTAVPYIGSESNHDFSFITNNTERARITAGGYFKASNAGTYFGSTGAYHELRQTTNNICVIASSSDANYSSTIYYADTTRAANAAFNLASWRANNVTQFEVSGAGVIYAQNTTVQSLSDGRLKENVSDATDGLNVINALRPVRYDWKAGYGNDRKNQLGFIAQEMETVFPEAVAEWKVRDDEEAYKTVGPGALIPVLVKAMQEQQAMINELKAKVAALEA